MSKKNKAADPFQKELQKSFQWTTQHSNLVVAAVVMILVIGGGLTLKSYFEDKKEATAQAAFFPVEKALLKKQAQFHAGDEPNQNKKNEPPAAQPTGDFAKDYGTEAAALEQVMSQYPDSKAAQMAGLHLASLQNDYKQFDAAEKTLEKVSGNHSDNLFSGLVSSELGNAQANRNDCESAIKTWDKALANKSVAFLQNSIKLKQALCYEALKNPSKAKSLYADIKAADKDGNLGKTAEKYSRLLGESSKE